MSTQVSLPTGSYVTPDPLASCKRLVNVFSEIAPQTAPADSKQQQPPVYLRRAQGIEIFADNGTLSPVRGFRTMQGITYTVIGPTLYSMDAFGHLTALGTGIPGNSFVRMVDNTECLFILVPGTRIAYTYCPNIATPFAAFTDPTFIFYGAIDVWFCDTFFVFLMLTGRGFYNDDGQVASGLGPPTFLSAAVFPRAFGTDLFVGMAVDHRDVCMFGALTSEVYTNNGNPTGSPFNDAPDGFLQSGMHPDCGYSSALQDQSVFWVANDRTVRRRNGQTPERVSNSGIEAILADADLRGCYALTPTIGGHPLWILTIPNESRSLVYDCLTTEWCERESLVANLGYWRPLCWYNAFGQQLLGDSQSGKVGYLTDQVFTEFGDPCRTEIITQAIYYRNERIVHDRVEIVLTAGGSTSLTAGATITLFVSDDAGQTWRARETKSLGVEGARTTRAFWTKLGQSRKRVYKFQLSDPTPMFTVDITANLRGGQW